MTSYDGEAALKTAGIFIRSYGPCHNWTDCEVDIYFSNGTQDRRVHGSYYDDDWYEKVLAAFKNDIEPVFDKASIKEHLKSNPRGRALYALALESTDLRMFREQAREIMNAQPVEVQRDLKDGWSWIEQLCLKRGSSAI